MHVASPAILDSAYSEPGRHLKRISLILSDSEGVKWFLFMSFKTTVALRGKKTEGKQK